MDDFVFHFSNTVHLPWILQSRQLEPDTNTIGGFPQDFLWHGDPLPRSAAPAIKTAYRYGHAYLIRFTCEIDAFQPWGHEMAGMAGQNTTLRRLNRLGGNLEVGRRIGIAASNPAQVREIHFKSYRDGKWQVVDDVMMLAPTDEAGPIAKARGIRIGSKVFMAEQLSHPSRSRCFQAAVVGLANGSRQYRKRSFGAFRSGERAHDGSHYQRLRPAAAAYAERSYFLS